MTQPGSDEMVYRVLLEHANNSAKSSEQSVESETNSASDLGGDKGSNTHSSSCVPINLGHIRRERL